MAYMPANDAPSAKLATAYATIDGNRYALLMAKNFEGKMNVETKEVPTLGRTVKGVKAVGASIKFSMTVYKVTEIFDELVERYKNTGLLPTFDLHRLRDRRRCAAEYVRCRRRFRRADHRGLCTGFQPSGEVHQPVLYVRSKRK